jgi:hypothetical protein
MTGFKSKRAAALDEDGMYLVHHTAQQDATMQSLKDLKRSVCDELGKAAFAQPAKRPWVDLTPQDLNEIFAVAMTGEGAVHLALEKIKEKNNG